jgi:hypothetical protein
MEGTPHCGNTTVTLIGDPKLISLEMTQEKCKTSDWMGAHGWAESSPTFFHSLNIDLNPPSITYAEFSSYQNSYSSAAEGTKVTGVEVFVPEYDLTGYKPLGLKSACYPTTNLNSIATRAKIPFGTSDSFPMYTLIKIYYGAVATCTGADCCTGPTLDYIFPNGLWKEQPLKTFAPTEAHEIKLKLIEKGSEKLRVDAPSLVPYGACVPVGINYLNTYGEPKLTETALPISVSCSGPCSLYSDGYCSGTPLTQATILPGSSSTVIYAKQLATTTRLGFEASGLTSAYKEIPTSTNYSLIDGLYVNQLFNEVAYQPPVNLDLLAPGVIVIYKSSMGRMGKMKINDLMTTNVYRDTMVFDYVTYDASGYPLFSAYQTVTACDVTMYATCSLNFDVMPALGTFAPYDVDLNYKLENGQVMWAQGATQMMVIYPN